MKRISVITGCFNEEENVEILYDRVRTVFEGLDYDFELIFADNCSTDGTIKKLRELAGQDRRVKVILNMRNFGGVRSYYHCLLQATGDAVVAMACDLQDPPELIPELIKLWEQGQFLVVAAVKSSTKGNPVIHRLRTMYYKLLNKLSNIELIEHHTGFGLYDQKVVQELRKLDDSYPYFRGLICELGFPTARVSFVQPERKRGLSKYKWYDLYDMAMLGLTSHSVFPMRIATILGFCLAGLSFLVALGYLIYKIIFWASFPLGMAPLIIGMFAMFSIQLIFIGLLGEYIGAGHRQLLHRPLVVERERINFDEDEAITSNGSQSSVAESKTLQSSPESVN